MMEEVAFSYAQARLQARHGARPTDATWNAIEAAVALSQFVENARGTTLAASLEFFGPTTSIHAAEQALRSVWRRGVFEAARWAPDTWRTAVRWLATATELPVLIHLQRGEPRPEWSTTDPEWRPALEAGSSVIESWIAQWRSRWPPMDADSRNGLETLIAQLRQHVAQMRSADSASAGRALRQDLRLRLAHFLHLHAQTPVALYAHLLLLALDLERLREGLIRRMVSQ